MTAVSHHIEALPSGAAVHVWASHQAPSAMVQLQHGFGEYTERFETDHHRFVPALLARGYEVWGLDLLGHGRSPGRRGVTDARSAVRDHRELRRRMRIRELPIVAFGHSFGGLVTAASVLADPIGVAGVALTGPAVLSRTPWPLRRLALGLSRILPAATVPGPAGELADLMHDQDVAARAAQDPLMYGRPATIRAGATALEVADGLWRRRAKWTVPLAIWHGTDDMATSWTRSRAYVRAVGSPPAELITVPGGRHELLHDHPGDDTVAEQIFERLARWTREEHR